LAPTKRPVAGYISGFSRGQGVKSTGCGFHLGENTPAGG
jgi:hypothetical protein